MPDFPDTLAVSLLSGSSNSNVVRIYDSGVARANSQNGWGVTALAFDPTGTTLYEAGSGYGKATVDGSGIVSATLLNSSIFTKSLRVDTGQAYLGSGLILNANTG